MKDRYQILMESLAVTGEGVMKCSGNSMLPVLQNPSTCYYRAENEYKVGDIVFCKVKGRYIDAHKITKKGRDGQFMIANNKGWENGWTRTIYGRVYRAEDNQGNISFFDR
jgi:phage repressor protein C with HTH and peptisase S24 domain